MIHEYALLTVDPVDTTAFEAAFPAATVLLTSSEGCASVEFQASVDQPGLYLMKVGWDHLEDHLDAFASSPAALELGDIFGRYFSAPPIVAHFER